MTKSKTTSTSPKRKSVKKEKEEPKPQRSLLSFGMFQKKDNNENVPPSNQNGSNGSKIINITDSSPRKIKQEKKTDKKNVLSFEDDDNDDDDDDGFMVSEKVVKKETKVASPAVAAVKKKIDIDIDDFDIDDEFIPKKATKSTTTNNSSVVTQEPTKDLKRKHQSPIKSTSNDNINQDSDQEDQVQVNRLKMKKKQIITEEDDIDIMETSDKEEEKESSHAKKKVKVENIANNPLILSPKKVNNNSNSGNAKSITSPSPKKKPQLDFETVVISPKKPTVKSPSPPTKKPNTDSDDDQDTEPEGTPKKVSAPPSPFKQQKEKEAQEKRLKEKEAEEKRLKEKEADEKKLKEKAKQQEKEKAEEEKRLKEKELQSKLFQESIKRSSKRLVIEEEDDDLTEEEDQSTEDEKDDDYQDDDEEFDMSDEDLKPKSKKTTVAPTTKKPAPAPAKKAPAKKAAAKKVKEEKDTTTDTPKKKAGNPAWKAGPRENPPNKGQKELPVGRDNCLYQRVFCITGVLDSLEREECQDLICRYGGRVVASVTSKLTHLIVGIDPGPSKTEKAKKSRIPIIDEDGLFKMISDSLPKPPPAPTASPPLNETSPVSSQSSETSISKPPLKKLTLTSTLKLSSAKTGTTSPPSSSSSPPSSSSFTPASSYVQPTVSSSYSGPSSADIMKNVVVSRAIASQPKGHDQLWVEKYKPSTVDDLIGNPGCMTELNKWMDQWHSSEPRDAHKKNAVLLSGPPGIGKTTAALMACKIKGFEPVELNASDTRSKSEIDRILTGASDNKIITSFFSVKKPEDNKKSAHILEKEAAELKKKKSCIILDEIDGSSGNEDRGGISEIIAMIKKSKIPFILICNDYHSPKIKSLKNHCLDLKFRRASAQSITNRLLQICKHEGLVVTQYILQRVFESTHSDIRQTINTLQMMSRSGTHFDNNNINQNLDRASKDMDLSAFTGAEKLFMDRAARLEEKMQYFFTDFSLVPLLIQENYLRVTPNLKTSDIGLPQKTVTPIELFSMAADSISDSDIFDREISRNMAWELLPSYAIVSSLIPTRLVSGCPLERGVLGFPSYLGKYSNASKQNRFVREIQLHMRSTGNAYANRAETRLYYVPMFKKCLIKPLTGADGKEGIPEVIEMMDDYGFTEEDRDNIIELSSWAGELDPPLKNILPPIKAAFTKTWRAGNHAIYDISMLGTKGSGGSSSSSAGYEAIEEGQALGSSEPVTGEDEENEVDQNEKVLSNLIKKSSVNQKKSTSTKSKSTTTKSTSSKSKSKSK
ncbi:hypothetical protein CYY_004888 [Polysphondylium violaceum]|uniref:BRCT domain-containing protein n=1 Tax=Polysphondylium violaceum TaxID=133409 RepID=A0A8J4PXD4_9MYCE|nr:hypothetical protein CYY_004888 [Polysphondylium violaceum]